jgi:anti-sigma factor RsiW
VLLLKIIFRSNEKGRIVKEAELSCKELTELITDYLEQRLSPVDRARFDQHLSVCPGCVTYIDQMRLTLEALSAKAPVEIPEQIESDLLKAFRTWKQS